MSLYTTVAKFALQALGVVVVALLTSIITQELRRPKNMPPTPGNKRPLPFFGNKLDIPKEKSWIAFRKWNEEYGPVLTVWNGTTPTILIGDPEIAVELMEKRSTKYSSRPRFVVAGDLLTENRTILFAPYGERWRAYRKALHLATMPKSVDTYRPVMEMEGKVLAHDILSKPEDWYNLIYRYTASSVVAIAYGRRVLDIHTDGAYQKLARNIDFLTSINVPGAQWHETFPALRFLPSFMNPIKKAAINFREQGRANLRSLVQEVQTKIQQGIAPHSYAKLLLENREKYPELDDMEFNGAPGSLFGAGVDTTSATLQSLVLALVLHPEVQRQAHEELDRVVGSGRSPHWDDEEKLVYVQAIIKEILRWRPVAILGGTPHASTEDDIFEWEGRQYFIPKGAIILGNLWSIHMNPKTYEDPEEFKPERFLGDRQYPGTGTKGHSSFGWGRRICPGAYFAERSLYLTATRLLWAFNFSKAVHPITGNEITPDASMETGYTSGFNTRPHPFPCKIEVRNNEIRETIEREAKDAWQDLKIFENFYD
ncbi:cytochrome P450 [Neolentinus lepideus HHB14362 ss-1]|uniref:Cytochrome P450 n=1 Tax=Neolentinus lepideus HHB14362 ss-1 TaxID=1314782 RepID=A0A165P422_9AGAM|nr:cytochrome P450 [Neolentinus lepideus HHB14362 ss-1]